MLADAFANTFWVALGLIAIAVIPALLLPSGRAHERSADAAAKECRRDRRRLGHDHETWTLKGKGMADNAPKVLLRSEKTDRAVAVVELTGGGCADEFARVRSIDSNQSRRPEIWLAGG